MKDSDFPRGHPQDGVQNVPMGNDPSHVYTFDFSAYLPDGTYDADQVWYAYSVCCNTVLCWDDSYKHGLGSNFRQSFCALSQAHEEWWARQMAMKYGKYIKDRIQIAAREQAFESARSELGYGD